MTKAASFLMRPALARPRRSAAAPPATGGPFKQRRKRRAEGAIDPARGRTAPRACRPGADPPAFPPPVSMPITSVIIGWQGGVVCGVLSAGLVVMGFDWVPPDLVFALMSSALMAAQILPARAAAAGFSNTGVLTVMALFVVAEGVSQTGALDAAFTLALGRAPSAAVAQARLMLPVLVARSGWGE